MKKTALLLIGTVAMPLWAQPRLTAIATQASDLSAPAVTAAMTPKAAQALTVGSLDTVASEYVWALDHDAKIDPGDRPFQQSSRQYWLDVDGRQLAQGVALPLTSAEAMVRISPLSKAKAVPLTVDQVEVQVGGRWWPAAAVTESFVDAASLAKAGLNVPENTVAFRLQTQAAAGPVMLRAGTMTTATAYVVHVYEPDSPWELQLSSDASTYLQGQTVKLKASLSAELDRVGLAGMLVAPDGETYPVQWRRGADGFEADISTGALAANAPGLWEARLSVDGQRQSQQILRHARTAFALAAVSARITTLQLDPSKSDDLGIEVGVKVALPGRYEVRGVIYGVDAQGIYRPVAKAHSAAWLATSAASLSLAFPSSLLAGSHLKAPYELRHLELKDQSRMSALWRQARAATIQP